MIKTIIKMKLNKLRVLSETEVELIHQESIRILAEAGVRVESEKARNKLRNHGAKVLGEGNLVKLSAEMIENALKTVPDHFSVFGPEGSREVSVNKKIPTFATQGSPTKIFDNRPVKFVRDALMDDFANFLKVAESAEHISCVHLDVWPTDVKYESVHKYAIPMWMHLSSKPFGMGCRGEKASRETVDILLKSMDDEEELRKKPRLMVFFNPMSPLILPENLTEGLFVMAFYKQPIIIAPAATAGMTAPVTLSGLLVQINAEILASITLVQIISPGCPVLYGSVSTPMDPFSLNVSWGAVETGLITSAISQMSDFYGIPSRAPGAITSSNMPNDIQSGFERMMNLMMAAYSGVDYITCAGTYANGEAFSLELMEIDNEMIGSILRGMRGIEVNNKNIPHADISAIVNGEFPNYLKLRHTLKNTRKEMFIPKLCERRRFNQWFDEGSQTMFERAAELVEKAKKTEHIR